MDHVAGFTSSPLQGFLPKENKHLFHFRLSEYLLIKVGREDASLPVNRLWALNGTVYVNIEDIYSGVA